MSATTGPAARASAPAIEQRGPDGREKSGMCSSGPPHGGQPGPRRTRGGQWVAAYARGRGPSQRGGDRAGEPHREPGVAEHRARPPPAAARPRRRPRGRERLEQVRCAARRPGSAPRRRRPGRRPRSSGRRCPSGRRRPRRASGRYQPRSFQPIVVGSSPGSSATHGPTGATGVDVVRARPSPGPRRGRPRRRRSPPSAAGRGRRGPARPPLQVGRRAGPERAQPAQREARGRPRARSAPRARPSGSQSSITA